MNILLSEKLLPIVMILFSGLLVAIADGFIKQVSLHAVSIWSIFRSPLMIPIALFYLFAIGAFSFAFIRRWDLGIIGILQIVLYSAAVVVYGIIFFHERLTLIHGLGMTLAVVAAVLMSI